MGPMTSLDSWVLDAAAALGVSAVDVPADLRKSLLDLTEQLGGVAGSPAGPMTGYVLGLAVGHGASPAASLQALHDLLRTHTERSGDDTPEQAGPPAPGADTSVPVARVQQAAAPAPG